MSNKFPASSNPSLTSLPPSRTQEKSPLVPPQWSRYSSCSQGVLKDYTVTNSGSDFFKKEVEFLKTMPLQFPGSFYKEGEWPLMDNFPCSVQRNSQLEVKGPSLPKDMLSLVSTVMPVACWNNFNLLQTTKNWDFLYTNLNSFKGF